MLSLNNRIGKQWRAFERQLKTQENPSKKAKSNDDMEILSKGNDDPFFYEKNFIWKLIDDFSNTLSKVTKDNLSNNFYNLHNSNLF